VYIISLNSLKNIGTLLNIFYLHSHFSKIKSDSVNSKYFVLFCYFHSMCLLSFSHFPYLYLTLSRSCDPPLPPNKLSVYSVTITTLSFLSIRTIFLSLLHTLPTSTPPLKPARSQRITNTWLFSLTASFSIIGRIEWEQFLIFQFKIEEVNSILRYFSISQF